VRKTKAGKLEGLIGVKEKRMKMLSIRRWVVCVMIGGFFLCSSSAGAIMRADAKQKPGSQGPTQEKTIENVNKIKRATELVQKIQNGVLHTNKNQYDLRGVKIIDHVEGHKVTEPSDGRKRVAEMIFVNDTLREVILHK
jgi:hypothetical protein